MVQAHASFDGIYSAMGDRKVPRSRCFNSHAGPSAMIVQCTDTVLHICISSQKCVGVFWCVFLQDLPPGELAFGFCFGMAIWNDSKQKLSHQEVMHNSGNWTKCNDWSAGLKRKCRLAMAPPQTWKRPMKYCHPYPAWHCRVHRIPSSTPFTCLFYKYL